MLHSPLRIIKARQALYQQIRAFFAQFLAQEVEVPLLHTSTATAPHLQSWQSGSYYLQTSPEIFMKRLLAAGSGDIFTICKVFRQGEVSEQHNPEFSMLEWYRQDQDEMQLMREIKLLLSMLLPLQVSTTLSYKACFERYLNVNPHRAQWQQLAHLATEHTSLDLQQLNPERLNPEQLNQKQLNRDDLLQWLMKDVIEPKLNDQYRDQILFIDQYPESQAELAQTTIDEDGDKVSRRFEVFVNGVELCNGYFELTDAQELQQRMEADNCRRLELNLPAIPIDRYFLTAVEQMPSCSGVAMGLDRLLQLQLKQKNIEQVLLFPWRTL